eukprot:5578749-Prymnesium_polylepis.1
MADQLMKVPRMDGVQRPVYRGPYEDVCGLKAARVAHLAGDELAPLTPQRRVQAAGAHHDRASHSVRQIKWLQQLHLELLKLALRLRHLEEHELQSLERVADILEELHTVDTHRVFVRLVGKFLRDQQRQQRRESAAEDRPRWFVRGGFERAE